MPAIPAILEFIVAHPQASLILGGILIVLMYFVTRVGIVVPDRKKQRYLPILGVALLAGGLVWRSSTASVLPRTCFADGESKQILNNQVLLNVRNIDPNERSTAIDIGLPGEWDITATKAQAGFRQNFSYRGKDYRLTLLEISSSSACLAVDRRL